MKSISATIKATRSMGRHLRSRIHSDELYWRYVANFKPSLTYHLFEPSLKDVQRDVVDSLRCNGIAITTVEDLGVQYAFKELDKAVWTLEATLSNTINQAREQIDTPGFKMYLLELLGPRPVLDPKDIFVLFGLHPVILGVVNSYFGMYVRLRSFNVWHNFPSSSPPRNAELWHRDPEDRYIVKLFVYLTDATEGIGPLAYALGTHGLGGIKCRPQASKAEGASGLCSTGEQASVVVPKAKWLTTMGQKGTVVLADTRGYHKAGLARGRERILYTCMFTSQVSPYPEHFERKTPISVYSDRALAFALDGAPTA